MGCQNSNMEMLTNIHTQYLNIIFVHCTFLRNYAPTFYVFIIVVVLTCFKNKLCRWNLEVYYTNCSSQLNLNVWALYNFSKCNLHKKCLLYKYTCTCVQFCFKGSNWLLKESNSLSSLIKVKESKIIYFHNITQQIGDRNALLLLLNT